MSFGRSTGKWLLASPVIAAEEMPERDHKSRLAFYA
jgi:hypothetical protein